MTRNPGNLTGPLLIIAGAALWGTTGTAQALGADDAPTQAVGTARIVLGGGVLLVFALVTRGWRAARLCRSTGIWPLLLAGIVGVAAYQLCFFAAVRSTGVALGTLVTIGSAPVLAGLLGYAIGERVGRRWIVATGIIVVGLVLLLLPGQEVLVNRLGVAAGLGAGLSYALYTVIGRRLLARGVDGVMIIGVMFGMAGLPLLVVAAPSDWTWIAQPSGLTAAVWLGLGATAVPYLLWIKGLARVPAATSASLSLAEPVTATLLGVMLLHEGFTLWGLLGVLTVLAGLFLVGRPDRRETQKGAAAGHPPPSSAPSHEPTPGIHGDER